MNNLMDMLDMTLSSIMHKIPKDIQLNKYDSQNTSNNYPYKIDNM